MALLIEAVSVLYVEEQGENIQESMSKEGLITSNIEENRGLLRLPHEQTIWRRRENPKLLQSLLVIFISRGGAYSAPFSSNDFYSPKKEGGKIWVYLRFLMIQNPTITATATITAAISMAISVVMNGASMASVGSGSIGPEGAGASVTPIAVSAYERQ